MADYYGKPTAELTDWQVRIWVGLLNEARKDRKEPTTYRWDRPSRESPFGRASDGR